MPESPILVTGGTGLAGRHVLDALTRRNVPVLRISRSPREGWYAADLTDPEAVSKLPAFSAVVHCAGLTPRRSDLRWADFERMNVTATANLARAALEHGASDFVLVSTMGRAVRGAQSTVGRLYVASKHLGERALRDKVKGKMRVWIIRAASMYGEGDRGSMARLIRAVESGRFVLPGSGAQRKCLLYAGSLGEIVAADLASRATTPILESAYDLELPTLAEIVRLVERSTNRRAFRLPLPSILIKAAIHGAAITRSARLREAALGASIALRDVSCCGANALARHPGLAVPLAEALAREVDWLRGD